MAEHSPSGLASDTPRKLDSYPLVQSMHSLKPFQMIMITARFEGSFSRKMELYRYGRSILSNGSEQDALDAPTISVCTTSQSYAHSELKEIALWLVST